MPDIDVLALLTATAAAFVASGVYYAMLGNQLATANATESDRGTSTPPWAIAVEVVRNLVVAAVAAGLAVEFGLDDWSSGVLLGLALWTGFPVVLWVGAVVHERTPVRLAAIHSGDWLIKLLIVTTIAAAWR